MRFIDFQYSKKIILQIQNLTYSDFKNVPVMSIERNILVIFLSVEIVELDNCHMVNM